MSSKNINTAGRTIEVSAHKNVRYAGGDCELFLVIVEDEHGNWDDVMAQGVCDNGGCVTHEGPVHYVYRRI